MQVQAASEPSNSSYGFGPVSAPPAASGSSAIQSCRPLDSFTVMPDVSFAVIRAILILLNYCAGLRHYFNSLIIWFPVFQPVQRGNVPDDICKCAFGHEFQIVQAARLRLRPILMTSFAFILSMMPLMLASGAGAEMRQVLGTAVFSGMLGITVTGLFLTPVFYVVIRGFGSRRAKTPPAA